jgi:predicted PurR-regulated permease PerM
MRALGIDVFENVDTFSQAIGANLQKISSGILNVVSALFGGIGSTIFIMTIAFFLSLEGEGINKFLKILVPKKYEDYALFVWQRAQNRVSGWFGSRVLMCMFVGLLFFITLWLFGIEYALILAVLAAVLDMVPFIGPIVTGVITFMLIGFDDPAKAILALIVFFLIQQIENSILAPVLTKKFVGISSVLVLLALAIGAKLAGIMGAILAIPLTGIISEFLRDFIAKRKEE